MTNIVWQLKLKQFFLSRKNLLKLKLKLNDDHNITGRCTVYAYNHVSTLFTHRHTGFTCGKVKQSDSSDRWPSIIFIIFIYWLTSTKPAGTKTLSLFGLTSQKLSAGNVLLNAILHCLYGPPATSAGKGIASPMAHWWLQNFASLDLGRIPPLVRSRILQFPLILEQTYEWSPGVHISSPCCLPLYPLLHMPGLLYCAGVTSRKCPEQWHPKLMDCHMTKA